MKKKIKFCLAVFCAGLSAPYGPTECMREQRVELPFLEMRELMINDIQAMKERYEEQKAQFSPKQRGSFDYFYNRIQAGFKCSNYNFVADLCNIQYLFESKRSLLAKMALIQAQVPTPDFSKARNEVQLNAMLGQRNRDLAAAGYFGLSGAYRKLHEAQYGYGSVSPYEKMQIARELVNSLFRD